MILHDHPDHESQATPKFAARLMPSRPSGHPGIRLAGFRRRIGTVPESDEDLARRVAALEEAVRRLDEQGAVSAADSAAARVLASGADRDVSEVRAELRAHTQALNALRETQREQGDALRDGFAKVNTTLQRIVDLLDPEQH
jgi:hypothetical protein